MQEILITGAGSGFGEGTALGLAQKGHNIIAAVQTWPQDTALREKSGSLGLKTLKVEKLDLLGSYDVAHALKLKFEILVNNAGIEFENNRLFGGDFGIIARFPSF